MEASSYYVYRHIRIDTNTPFYVGKGKKRRAYDGCRSRNSYWKHIVKKVGHRVEIVMSNLTQKEAFDKELQLIKAYKSFGYCEANFTLGGDGGLGLDEFYKKRGARKRGMFTGEKNPMYGKKASELCRAKARENALKYPFTDEHRARSMAKTSKKVVNDITGEVYISIFEACKDFKIKRSTLAGYLRRESPNPTPLNFLSPKSKNQDWREYAKRIQYLLKEAYHVFLLKLLRNLQTLQSPQET